MLWIFAAACFVLLLLTIDEANSLRAQLADQQIAMNEQAARLAAAHRALAAIEEEQRRSLGALPARLSCAIYRDHANGRPITIYRN